MKREHTKSVASATLGSSLYSNQDQIRAASENKSWNGVLLTTGYGAVAALGAGLGANSAVGNSLGKGIDGGVVWSSASNSGLNAPHIFSKKRRNCSKFRKTEKSDKRNLIKFKI